MGGAYFKFLLRGEGLIREGGLIERGCTFPCKSALLNLTLIIVRKTEEEKAELRRKKQEQK